MREASFQCRSAAMKGGNEVKSEANEREGRERKKREKRMNVSLCVRIELEFPRYTEAEQGGPRL